MKKKFILSIFLFFLSPFFLLAQENCIKIASFNIQVFGQSKIKNKIIMQTISKIVKNYDLVAIQEVRSTKENVIPTLLDYLNDSDTNYDYVISGRLGRKIVKNSMRLSITRKQFN